jgi:hypothetical protein
VRVATVIATWEGPVLDARDMHVDALYGDRFLRDIQPGSNVRVSIGWRSGAGFEPFAVGSEVTAPRMVPVESVAQEVARFEADPVVMPFQSRSPEPLFAQPSPLAPPSPLVATKVGAPVAAFVERVRAATHAHGAPVDTGVETWGPGPADAIPPREEEEEVEEQVAAPWFEPGGSSELSRGGPGAVRRRTVRRLIPGRPGGPGVPGLSFGGASELSR